MKGRIRLAEVPRFASEEYCPQQVECYRILTETTFRVLNLPSVSAFLDSIAQKLGIQDEIEARVCRVPSAGQARGSLLGSHKPRTGTITLYPLSLWPDPKTKPGDIPDDAADVFCVHVIQTIIHELLHRSGVHDENRVREMEKKPFEEFMRLYRTRFREEFDNEILGPYVGQGEKHKEERHTR